MVILSCLERIRRVVVPNTTPAGTVKLPATIALGATTMPDV